MLKERQAKQEELVATLFERFKTHVKTHRKLMSEDDVIFSGAVWLGSEARDLGLIDSFGDLYGVLEAIERESGPIRIERYGPPKASRLSQITANAIETVFKTGIDSLVKFHLESQVPSYTY